MKNKNLLIGSSLSVIAIIFFFMSSVYMGFQTILLIGIVAIPIAILATLIVGIVIFRKQKTGVVKETVKKFAHNNSFYSITVLVLIGLNVVSLILDTVNKNTGFIPPDLSFALIIFVVPTIFLTYSAIKTRNVLSTIIMASVPVLLYTLLDVLALQSQEDISVLVNLAVAIVTSVLLFMAILTKEIKYLSKNRA